MIWVGGMVRVLRRLRQLRHIYVVVSLGETRVDVRAWGAVGLLSLFISSVVCGFRMGSRMGGGRKWRIGKKGKGREIEIAYRQLGHDGLELRRAQEAGISKELELGADSAQGAVGGRGFDAHCFSDGWMDGWMLVRKKE